MKDNQLDNILKKHFQNKIDNVSIRLRYEDIEKPTYYQKPQGIWFNLAYGLMIIILFAIVLVGMNTNTRSNALSECINNRIEEKFFDGVAENLVTIKESFENYMKNKTKNN